MYHLAAVAIAALPLATAFQGTVPLVVKSSIPDQPSWASANLSPVSPASDVYSALSASGPSSIGCSWTGLAIVEVAGLHKSHLSQLSRRSGLTVQKGTTDVLNVPYVQNADSAALEEAAWQWVAGCEERDIVETGEKVARAVQMIRVGEGEAIDSPLVTLKAFVADHPSSLVIITGTPSSSASAQLKRQLVEPSDESLSELLEEVLEQAEQEEADVEEYLEEVFPDLFEEEDDYTEDYEDALDSKPLKHKNKHKNGTHSDPDDKDNSDGYYDLVKAHRNSTNNGTRGPLFEHAQILSTPIITALLISFGILLPILFVGIYSLAGIQVPPYLLSTAKSMGPSVSKKDQ